MGADLVPLVDNFIIENRSFGASDCAVVEGCATVGNRKLLGFDFIRRNAGDAAAHLGSPAAHPQWFVWSLRHNHWHLKAFNNYRLSGPCGSHDLPAGEFQTLLGIGAKLPPTTYERIKAGAFALAEQTG